MMGLRTQGFNGTYRKKLVHISSIAGMQTIRNHLRCGRSIAGIVRVLIAIQSTIGRLKRSFNANDERIWIGDVEYIDFREWEPGNRFFNVNTPNTLNTFFLKWHYFKYENEIRAVINKAYNKHRAEKGILVKSI